MQTDSFRLPGLVLAYHGCDKSVADRVIAGKERLKDSTNDYDWLGHGQYFWENNFQRAYDWACEAIDNPKLSIKNPAVIGAVIDLGTCLNLLDTTCIKLVKVAHASLVEYAGMANIKLPKNKQLRENKDLLLRRLDCAVIEHLHTLAEQEKCIRFDTIRGVFPEGEPLYENAGFREKNHIQICVVNPKSIRGYFIPR